MHLVWEGPHGLGFNTTSAWPQRWRNVRGVEFVFSRSGVPWIEPRCTVESVDGKIVKRQQGDNSSWFHRLYYYAQCFNNGQGAGRSLTCKGSQCRGRNPTSIENVRSALFFGV